MQLKKISFIFIIFFLLLILFTISFHVFNWNKTHNFVKNAYIYDQLRNFYSNKESPIKTYFSRQLDILYFNSLNLINKNPSKLDRYSISIDETQLRENENKISNILKRDKTLRSEDRYWLNGVLSYENIPYGIKMRLRGDQPNHWENKKKSWKIEIENNEFINNYNSFSLIIPSDRWLEIGHLANEISARIGVLSLNSKYILLDINKKNHGLYFWTENFNANFLERHKYPAGQIFIGNDVPFDKIEKNKNNNQNLEYEFLISSYKMLIKNDYNMFNSGNNQFRGFLRLLKSRDLNNINKDLSNYLDIEKFAKWYSLVLLFGSDHSEKIDNLPWYYNSLTGLIEPIFYDVELQKRDPNLLNSILYNEVVKTILLVPSVRAKITEEVYNLISLKDEMLIKHNEIYENIKYYLYTGIEPINKKLNSIGSVNYDDLYYSHKNRKTIFEENIESMKNWISDTRIFIENEIFLEKLKNKLIFHVKIINDSNINVVLNNIKINFNNSLKNYPFRYFSEINIYSKDIFDDNINKINVFDANIYNNEIDINLSKLNIGSSNKQISYIDKNHLIEEYLLRNYFEEHYNKELFIELVYDEDTFSELTNEIKHLNLKYFFINNNNNELIKNRNVRTISLFNSEEVFFESEEDLNKKLNIKNKVSNHNQEIISTLNRNKINFEFNSDKKEFIIKEGNYKIDSTLIFDKEYKLVVENGTIINLDDGVSIILNGPLFLNGSENKPIKITKSNVNWGTLSILNSKEKSFIKNSIIEYGGSKNRLIINNKHYTGMINFFYSDVDIINSVISNANIEDGINIKYSNYNIKNSKFFNNKSDGFDGDWSNGMISNSSFSNNSNDGIDISGSNVKIIETDMSYNGDKSLSVGEDSNVTIRNSNISNSLYGLVSKDLSHLNIIDTKIYNNEFGVAAYRKKPIFGGGIIKLKNNQLSLNELNYVRDEYSKILEKNIEFEVNYMEHLDMLNNIESQKSNIDK